MADKAEYLQAIDDAILDADSLERFINGSDSETVLTRLSAKYPTLQNAIKKMFENGGLPATPFRTKALMEASSLANDAYAAVTNDPIPQNNGLYIKTNTGWDAGKLHLATEYDVLRQVITYMDDYRQLSKDINLTYRDFNTWGGLRSDGTTTPAFDRFKRTKPVRVSRGDTYTFDYFMPVNTVPLLIFYDEDKRVVQAQGAAKFGRQYYTISGTVANDGYMVAQHGLHDYNVPKTETDSLSLKIARKTHYYVTDKELNSKYVSGYKSVTLTSEITAGGYIPTSYNMRSEPINKGTLDYIHLKRENGVIMGFREGYTPEGTQKGSIRWFSENKISVALNKSAPYVTVYASGAEAMANPPFLSKLAWFDSKNATLADVPTTKEILSSVGLPNTFSSFRTPSLAQGGMLTIIDDDGREEVFTELLPFCKGNNIPFGAAIVAGAVDGTFEGRKTLTTEQVRMLAAEKDIVEIMTHGWEHMSYKGKSRTSYMNDIIKSKKWFLTNGIDNVSLFALPYGQEDDLALRCLQLHYNGVFDYGGQTAAPNKMGVMTNYRIERLNFPKSAEKDTYLPYLKSQIDSAVSNNAWLVLTTHIAHPTYWDDGNFAFLQETVEYARAKGMKIELPSVGFQTFGNIVENDSGFKIQADGKIIGAS